MSTPKEYDSQDIAEILVTLKNGNKIIYREAGINKLKKILSAQQKQIIVVETSEGEDSEEELSKKKKEPRQVSSGYNLIPLNYSAPKNGKSPMDLAKDLQRQAEASSGFKY